MTAKHFMENNIYILHLLARSKMLATVLLQDLNKYQTDILSLKKTCQTLQICGLIGNISLGLKTFGRKEKKTIFLFLLFISNNFLYKITIWHQSQRSSPQSSGRLENGNSTIKTKLIITFYCKIIKNNFITIYYCCLLLPLSLYI